MTTIYSKIEKLGVKFERLRYLRKKISKFDEKKSENVIVSSIKHAETHQTQQIISLRTPVQTQKIDNLQIQKERMLSLMNKLNSMKNKRKTHQQIETQIQNELSLIGVSVKSLQNLCKHECPQLQSNLCINCYRQTALKQIKELLLKMRSQTQNKNSKQSMDSTLHLSPSGTIQNLQSQR